MFGRSKQLNFQLYPLFHLSRFQEFKSCENRSPSMKVKLAGSGHDAEKFRLGQLRGKAQNWARFLSDMPANHMTPVQLAQVHFSTEQLLTTRRALSTDLFPGGFGRAVPFGRENNRTRHRLDPDAAHGGIPRRGPRVVRGSLLPRGHLGGTRQQEQAARTPRRERRHLRQASVRLTVASVDRVRRTK